MGGIAWELARRGMSELSVRRTARQLEDGLFLLGCVEQGAAKGTLVGVFLSTEAFFGLTSRG